jgi:hypothetical protein
MWHEFWRSRCNEEALRIEGNALLRPSTDDDVRKGQYLFEPEFDVQLNLQKRPDPHQQ